MANVNNPNGFMPYKNPHGGSGQPVVEYLNLAAANSAIGVGDPLTSTSGYIDRAAASAALIGIAAEAKAASSGDTKIAVWSDPAQRFVAQTDDGTATSTSVAAAQANCNFVAGTPSNGRSIAELDQDSATTTATLPFKLLELAPRLDNAYGEFNRWVVVINNHQLKGGTGTAGT